MRFICAFVAALAVMSGVAACGEGSQDYVIVVTFRDRPAENGLEDVADTLKSYGARYGSSVELVTEIVRPPRITARLEADADVCDLVEVDVAPRADVAEVECKPG